MYNTILFRPVGTSKFAKHDCKSFALITDPDTKHLKKSKIRRKREKGLQSPFPSFSLTSVSLTVIQLHKLKNF